MTICEFEQMLRKWVLAGKYVAGDKLPSLRALCEEFSVSYVTAQKAIRNLEKQGLLETRRGCGTYVVGRGMAKAMQSVGSHEILFVCPTDRVDKYELELYQHLQMSLRKLGFLDRMVIGGQQMKSKELDGIAGAIVTHQCTLSEQFQQHNIPIVYCTSVPVDASISSVNPDFQQGCADAVRYLYDCGHQTILFATALSSEAEIQTFGIREQGYRDGMEICGLEAQKPLLWHVQKNVNDVKKTLLGNHRPDAILAANDVIAVEILQFAQELGLHIPDDISLMGLEDMLNSRISRPQVSTVGYSQNELAEKTVNLLWEVLDGVVTDMCHKKVSMQVIPRESIKTIIR